MTLDEIMQNGIEPGLSLLPPKMRSLEARVMLLTIGLQESKFEHRRQLVGNPPKPTGPAKSYFQAERGGGMVAGVRTHPATKDIAAGLYAERGVAATNEAIWDAIESDDVLASALARLLLWSDPAKLPSVHDVEGAWKLYLRTWRPGAYDRGDANQRTLLRAKWNKYHDQVLEFLGVA